jgi:uncharacterized protein DUF5825
VVKTRDLPDDRGHVVIDITAGVQRQALVDVARLGFRHVRFSGHYDVSIGRAAESVRLLRAIREAMGVGLRVMWFGSVDSPIRPRVLHLDPPRGPEGRFQWEPVRTPYPRVRIGPTFSIIEDGPDCRRTVDGAVHRALAYSWGGGEHELSQAARAALLGAGLAVEIGSELLVTPIRYRVLR